MSNRHETESRVKKFFEEKAQLEGPNAVRVGWNSPKAQTIRFDQLLKIVIDPDEGGTLLDFGCGLGDLAGYLREHSYKLDYSGYDITLSSIEQARKLHPGFTFASNLEDLGMFDYVIASGLFTINFAESEEAWDRFIKDTIHTMWSRAKQGIAFNCLTAYSDPHLMRDELYYPRPEDMFAYCKTTYSRNVALLHDYDLYDFTILVRKNGALNES